jgi:hypothetical protein
MQESRSVFAALSVCGKRLIGARSPCGVQCSGLRSQLRRRGPWPAAASRLLVPQLSTAPRRVSGSEDPPQRRPQRKAAQHSCEKEEGGFETSHSERFRLIRRSGAYTIQRPASCSFTCGWSPTLPRSRKNQLGSRPGNARPQPPRLWPRYGLTRPHERGFQGKHPHETRSRSEAHCRDRTRRSGTGVGDAAAAGGGVGARGPAGGGG